MKKPIYRTLVTGVVDALLLTLGIWGMLGLLVRTFSLGVDLGMLLAWGLGLCLLNLILFSLPRGRWLALLLYLSAYTVALWLFREQLVLGLQATASAVMSVLESQYGFWGWIQAAPAGSGGNVFLFLLFLTAGIACCLAWAIVRGRSLMLGVAVTLPFFALCAASTTEPDVLFLAMTVLFWALLALGSLTSAGDIWQGTRVMLFSLVPIGALLVGLWLLSPPETFQRSPHADALRLEIESVTGRFLEEGTSVALESGAPVSGDLWYQNSSSLDLTAPAPAYSGQTVLSVLAQDADTIYLRGFSLEEYTGTGWQSLPETYLNGDFLTSSALEAVGETLRTLYIDQSADASGVAYLPYYSLEAAGEEGSGIYARTYLTGGDVFGLGQSGLRVPEELEDFEHRYRTDTAQIYTQLPEETRAALLEIAVEAGLTADMPLAQLAQAVADFVGQRAQYDLNAAPPPAGTDSVLYFLQESRSGWCVHFASAAAALLRALDVPTRFVSGFVCAGAPGNWVDVPDSSAHAWVEVYYEGLGWVPLEVTPGGAAAITPTAPVETPVPTPSPTPDPWEAPSAAPSPTPAPGTAGVSEAEAAGIHLSPWLLCLLILPAAWAALWLRRRLARERRRAWEEAPDRNRAAAAAWQYLERLAPYGVEPPKEISELALKAAFSQHVLSAEELHTVTGFAQEAGREVDASLSWPRRLIFRYFRGLF